MRALVWIGALFLIAVPVDAQLAGNPESWCREGFFTRESNSFRIGTVKGTRNARVYFYNDNPGDCPNSPTCRANAYLVPGDRVIVNRTFGRFACSWFVPVKGSATVGWIEMGSLRVNTPRAPGLSEWLGDWKYADNSMSFTHNKLRGFLNVTGNAMWRGLGDNVHVGEMDGRYEPSDGIIRYADGEDENDCRATIRLIGNFLVVADNLRCGGANVSFSGIYVRSQGQFKR